MHFEICIVTVLRGLEQTEKAYLLFSENDPVEKEL